VRTQPETVPQARMAAREREKTVESGKKSSEDREASQTREHCRGAQVRIYEIRVV
jgi:hypothetical protein